MDDATFKSRFPDATGPMAIVRTRNRILLQVFDPDTRETHAYRTPFRSTVFNHEFDEMLGWLDYERTGEWQRRRFGRGKVYMTPVRTVDSERAAAFRNHTKMIKRLNEQDTTWTKGLELD